MPAVSPHAASTASRLGLRTVALAYLTVLLLAPLALVFYRAFEDGFGTFWEAVTSPAALNALWLTVIITAIVVPLNAIFGVLTALILVRRRVPARSFVSALIDLPLALSPVVVGLCIILVWGPDDWLGQYASDAGVQVIFALPGMILATIFVCLPFVVREVVPVLREVGTDSGGGRLHPRRERVADLLAHHAPGHPLGRHLRRRPDHRAGARGVRRGGGGVQRRVSGDTETLPLFG